MDRGLAPDVLEKDMVCPIGHSLLDDLLIAKQPRAIRKAAIEYSLLEGYTFGIETLTPLLALLQPQSM